MAIWGMGVLVASPPLPPGSTGPPGPRPSHLPRHVAEPGGGQDGRCEVPPPPRPSPPPAGIPSAARPGTLGGTGRTTLRARQGAGRRAPWGATPCTATTGMLLCSDFSPDISLGKAAGSGRAEPMKNAPHPSSPPRRSGRVSPAVRGRLGRAVPSRLALIPGGLHLLVGHASSRRSPSAACGSRRVSREQFAAVALPRRRDRRLRSASYGETGAECRAAGLGGRAGCVKLVTC